MSVKIKRFEMPNNCLDCEISHRDEQLRDRYYYCPLLGYGVDIYENKRDEKCPLVEIPKKNKK